MSEIIKREFIYLWYYFDIQFRQIFWYWVSGIVIGSVVSVFVKEQIHAFAQFIGQKVPGILGLILASILGIVSPLCMYGTIPVCAAFSCKGIKDDFLASFMMSSILLNPQLVIYSTALGPGILTVRVVSCFICGITAGLLVRFFYRNKPYFNFSGFDEPHNHDTDPNIIIRLIKNIGRNIRATGGWFLIGIVLSALFQRYVPQDVMGTLFGKNRGFGVLLAAAIGVPLYVCGGGTIPLIIEWLAGGMSAGSAAAFMITGPSTKITNLGALKITLGVKNFCIYIGFVVIFSVITGAVVDLIM